jgi:hypothetical protein
MTWLAWSLSVFIVALALLYVSPKLRKTAFIWFTYVSLTGWYYFRLWEKRRARTSTNNNGALIPTSAKLKAKAKAPAKHRPEPVDDRDADVEDVVYFESAETLLQQRELRETAARLSGSSSSGNSHSGYSDDSLSRFSTATRTSRPSTGHHHQPKTHLGIFRSLRKAKTMERSSNVGSSHRDTLASSSVSEPGVTTRRTYTGRKKPESWGD